MTIRLSKVDEFQLLTCLQHGLWGSMSARFKDWHIGDGLVITVDKRLTALAEVSGGNVKTCAQIGLRVSSPI